jgi:beta-glucanase (GH16 family)
MGAFLLGASSVQSGDLYVIGTNGSMQIIPLNDLQRLTFTQTNLVVHKTTEVLPPIPLTDLQYFSSIALAQDYYYIHTKDAGVVAVTAKVDSIKVEGTIVNAYQANIATYSKASAQIDSITFVATTTPLSPVKTLIWHDEFDYEGQPDPAFWSFEQGFVRNEELQWYQSANANCHNGILTIEARKQQILNPGYVSGSASWKENRQYAEYTSSCIKTEGKRDFQYGRFEIRAKIPTALGSWPAIWTLGKSLWWPSCGEIDILEYYIRSGTPHILANTAWGTNTSNVAVWDTGAIPFTHFTDADANWADKFHIWVMDWNDEAIRLYLDDELLNETLLTNTQNGSHGNYYNPFKQPHYILLNLAVGANGGTPDDAAFPLKYEIDYVRVYNY